MHFTHYRDFRRLDLACHRIAKDHGFVGHCYLPDDELRTLGQRDEWAIVVMLGKIPRHIIRRGRNSQLAERFFRSLVQTNKQREDDA